MGGLSSRLRAAGFGDLKIAAKNDAGDLLEELHANTLFSAAITAQKGYKLVGQGLDDDSGKTG